MAHMLLALMAVTPKRRSCIVPALGLGTMLHCVPFQCSVSVFAAVVRILNATNGPDIIG